EAAYRKALALKRDYAEAHCNLSSVLRRQGKFADALAAVRRGHEIGSRNTRWPYPSAEWVRSAERLAALDARLPRFLSGEVKPHDAGEAVWLAWLCQQPFKQRYSASARFYAEAFAAEPQWAEDLRARHRYNAACAAALAGCGR